MKNYLRKITAIGLAVLMSVCVLPVSAEEMESDPEEYTELISVTEEIESVEMAESAEETTPAMEENREDIAEIVVEEPKTEVSSPSEYETEIQEQTEDATEPATEFAPEPESIVPDADLELESEFTVEDQPEEPSEEEEDAETELFAVKDGFDYLNGTLGFYKNGKLLSSSTGLVKGTINGKTAWYYIEKGIYVKATGLAQKTAGNTDKKWYYIKNGEFNKATGITKKIDTSKDARWYYVKNGTFHQSSLFSEKANGANKGTLYWVENGVFKSANGLVKGTINGKTAWYYIRKGVYTKATGLTKKADTSIDKKWYYVKNGIFNKTTAIAKKTDGADKREYYVKNGIFNAATIQVTFGDKKYTIQKGVVTKVQTTAKNYNSYLGTWRCYGSVSGKQQVTEEVIFTKISGNQVTFEILQYWYSGMGAQYGIASRIPSATVTGTIASNGTISFTFHDSYDNDGKGTIKLNGGSISVKTEITKPALFPLAALDVNATLTKSK